MSGPLSLSLFPVGALSVRGAVPRMSGDRWPPPRAARAGECCHACGLRLEPGQVAYPDDDGRAYCGAQCREPAPSLFSVRR